MKMIYPFENKVCKTILDMQKQRIHFAIFKSITCHMTWKSKYRFNSPHYSIWALAIACDHIHDIELVDNILFRTLRWLLTCLA